MPLRLCCIPRKTSFGPGGKKNGVRIPPLFARTSKPRFWGRTSSQIDTHRLVPIRHLQVDQIRRGQRDSRALDADIDPTPFLHRLLDIALRGAFHADISSVGVQA